ncbi:hypothetical protein B5G28_03865 [Faecalibacterium sp. An77]|nr:hypothetical protein B5G28_03865 [Faecalibacterium sp. An77]
MFSRFLERIPLEKHERSFKMEGVAGRNAPAGPGACKNFLRYLKKTRGIPRISRQNGPFIRSKGKEAGKK